MHLTSQWRLFQQNNTFAHTYLINWFVNILAHRGIMLHAYLPDDDVQVRDGGGGGGAVFGSLFM